MRYGVSSVSPFGPMCLHIGRTVSNHTVSLEEIPWDATHFLLGAAATLFMFPRQLSNRPFFYYSMGAFVGLGVATVLAAFILHRFNSERFDKFTIGAAAAFQLVVTWAWRQIWAFLNDYVEILLLYMVASMLVGALSVRYFLLSSTVGTIPYALAETTQIFVRIFAACMVLGLNASATVGALTVFCLVVLRFLRCPRRHQELEHKPAHLLTLDQYNELGWLTTGKAVGDLVTSPQFQTWALANKDNLYLRKPEWLHHHPHPHLS